MSVKRAFRMILECSKYSFQALFRECKKRTHTLDEKKIQIVLGRDTPIKLIMRIVGYDIKNTVIVFLGWKLFLS